MRQTLLLVMVFAWTLAPLQGVAAEQLACAEIEIFVRDGCPFCQQAKQFLQRLQARYPELRINERNVEQDATAASDFRALMEARRIRQPGVPAMNFCGEVLMGYRGDAITGAVLERVVTGQQQSVTDSLATRLPVFGDISPAAVGLPLFTVMIGLVDGFNPCAMWVLLFLLSLLVHVRERARIVMIAGTFVLVSGIVYFAFMAAWFNAFMLIGYSRGLQLVLGIVALLIGAVHVKDFFLLGRGLSLSIPEGVKPTIYERARRVVRAENTLAALFGVASIAVLVNFVELLCTAGLPALYTQVLTYYALDTAGYYGYLLLYNLAYIADDTLMVTIAVITLGQQKLQQQQGRWLKLISGSVICILGLLLVLAPDLLLF